ncbi:hypothetical protein BKA56DRAFT_115644 [Ilyonectria sp. MPI-CAGE-AT-0026]|nr:hypothetical protein BKA56DRAFT_115644 [Ilyonectria sp. MPI-CAGE-AT-0026]
MDLPPPDTHYFPSISTGVDKCRICFIAAHDAASRLMAGVTNIPPDDISLPDVGKIKIEQDRFSMWAGNANAFERGHGSLDYRLRACPEELDLVYVLLGNICSTLDEYRMIVESARLVERRGSGAGGKDSDEKHSTAIYDLATSITLGRAAGANESMDSSATPNTFDYTEALKTIHSSIDWLHRLSKLLRNASVANQNSRARSYNMPDFDADSLKLFFERGIRRDFPDLSEQLKSRLASTMVERYRRVLYRRARLGSGWRQQEPIKSEGDLKKPMAAEMSLSKLHAMPAPATVNSKAKVGQPETQVAALEPSLLSLNTGTDLHTSIHHVYATSAASKTQSVALSDKTKMLLPLPPSTCQTDPTFVCDFCCETLDSRVANDGALWVKHMQQDLDPYVCLFNRCKLPHDIYSTNEEWLHHMRSEHLVQWRCPATDHDDLDFGTREELSQHMTNAHPKTFKEDFLSYILEACRISSVEVFKSCPFCGQSPDAIEEHVSYHLRYLALQSLLGPENADEVGVKEHQLALNRADSSIVERVKEERNPNPILSNVGEAKQVIQAALSEFKSDLNDAQIARFTATTVQHVQAKVLAIQRDQIKTKQMMNFNRFKLFFEALKQFDDVTRSLDLGIPHMSAFIWGPTSSVILVAKEDKKALDSILTSYAHFGERLPLIADYKALLAQQPEIRLCLAWMYQDLLHFNSSLFKLFNTRCWKKTFAANWKDYESQFSSLARSFDDHGKFLKKVSERQQNRSIEEIRSRLDNSTIQHQGDSDDIDAVLEDYRIDRSQESPSMDEAHRRINDSIIQYQGDRDYIASLLEQHRQHRESWLSIDVGAEKTRKEKQYFEVSMWLSSPGVNHLENEYHSLFCEVRSSYPDTGQWILQEYQLRNWIQEEIPDHPILWICAKKGAGKTILASLIIEHLMENTNLREETAGFKTSYFYCRESEQNLNEPRFLVILKSLLRQMISHNRDLLPTLHDKRMKGQETLNDEASAKALIELVGDIGLKQFIVIDGLDELSQFHQDSLVRFLDSFVSKTEEFFPGYVRVMYLSIDVAILRNAMKTTDRITEYVLDPRDTGKDIEAYMAKKGDQLQEIFALSDQQVHRARELTCKRSNGMFLYAFLVSENLLKQPNARYVMMELEEAIFPVNLGQAYQRNIERLRTTLHANTWREARKIFGWLAYAKRPLKWYELQAALSVNIDDQGGLEVQSRRIGLLENIQAVCGSLVHMPGGTRIEFIHRTAKEYIMENENLDAKILECELALLCLGYLSHECFQAVLKPQQRESWAKEGQYALQDYAVSQWQKHLKAFIESSPALFNDVGNSAGYTPKTAGVLQTFCDVYGNDLKEINELQTETEAQDMDQAKKDCRLFEQQDFHTNLLRVWRHVVRHQNQGFEERNKVSMKQLDDVLKETRATLESLASEVEGDGELTKFYGENAFKCTRITCDYFYEGFDNKASAKNHSNRHDRPFPCTVPECSFAPFGFSSSNALDKHLRTYHPDISDQLSGLAQLDRRVVPNAKFQCTLCQRSYTRQENLDGHMNSAHLGARPYACSTCGKEFARKSDRTRHEKIHLRLPINSKVKIPNLGSN